MIILDVILSVAAVFVGSVAGSLFWTFHLGLSWLRRALLDDSGLLAFWMMFFKPHGGVAAMIRAEEIELDKPNERTAFMCSTVIGVELVTFIRMRRYCAIALVALCSICLLISVYTSVAVVICLACGITISPPLRNQNYPKESLATIFRSVRIWMGADSRSLDEHGAQCIRGVVRVIGANEVNPPSRAANAAA